ncbi:hypothetical protein GYA93_15680 [Gordonia desulfuricans]|uniref:Uncharacterized protein n=1 Tax=Gordonia desulfuricans TaxID=89051 RepID=A0A7K3LRX3_9ACTN|nr:hypothetical protein [Gordonia desulfuricans]NDK91012.1 hypothetical protein [Gordonia desulfuricans]
MITTAQVADTITTAGLNPANYDLAKAAQLTNELFEGGCATEDDYWITTADLWETLAGTRDETVPATDEAADAAWDISEAMTEASGWGGIILAA